MKSWTRPTLALSLLCFVPAAATELRLDDGSVLRGELLSHNDTLVVLSTESLGELRIPARRVVEGLPRPGNGKGGGQASRDRDPSGQALFFLPTAFTPQRGNVVFRDFELLFLTLGISVTDATSVTFGGLFPVTSEFQMFTIGFKQRLLMSANGSSAVSVTGSFVKPVGDDIDLNHLVNGNVVASRRFSDERFSDAFGLHGAIGYAGVSYDDDRFDNGCYCNRSRTRWEGNVSYGFGGEARLTPNAKFMAEYLSASPFDPTESGVGLLTLGFRLHGTRLSADIAGIRPIMDEDLEGLLFYPLLNVGYRF
jgi:hypothetical protein